MNKKIALWIIAILVTIASADALGMIPAKTAAAFLSDESRIYELTVVNNDHVDMELSIYPKGELAPFIEVLDPEIIMSNEDDYKKVRFKINPVEDILGPGIKEGRIVIEEGLNSIKLGSSSVSARLKLNHKVYLNVPYPEKYIESKIDINDLGSDIEIKNKIKNKGSKAVNGLKIGYDIKEGSRDIDKIEESLNKILSKDEAEVKSYINKDKINYGEYELKAVMNYEGNSLELNRVFDVGRPDIEIRSYNHYLISNKINEFDMDLENRWNKALKGVYFEIELFKDSKRIYSSKSISFDISAKGSQRVTSYIDTREMDEGEYKGDVKIHFKEEIITKDIGVNVISEKEHAKAGDKSSFGFWAAIINTLLLGGFMIYYFSKKRKKNLESG